MSRKSTIVVGGGLVGLTAAVSLKLIGHEVIVLEKAPQIRAVGAGIGLWANALREFDHLGIGPEIRDMGIEHNMWFFNPAGDPVRAPGYTDRDHQFLLVPRPELNNLLADTIGRDRIRLDAHVTGYTETGSDVVVHLANGETLRTDLLIGSDGVHSNVRKQLVPGSDAVPHSGHYSWRAIVPTGNQNSEPTVLTVGHRRTRGGYARIARDRAMWMVNQFDAGPLTGSKRERALERARNLTEAGWNDDLLSMIAETPEESILENQVTLVPELPHWTSARVALIGDAAHGLSPHIASGGTLGIEDVGVLRSILTAEADLEKALTTYEHTRSARFDTVREHSTAVEHAGDAVEFAQRYATFSHWMLTTAPATP
ncbi:2-polyprenyl-6-methoxyphenol hydroxylase-like FAD-dependent oxidoreductase [Streptomyces umbrinus]|uniref:2-polyprenyl-6-methoxyphenol hydroxylase-like FAD-dependent oxidoreductase n=1 Tax=Streptomyces umbrinus TaxID=67370 RepID=A0ABU0SIJ6_9ACTN|nr:FAD-dependent monooxygenase [Streptomyces umbrinus]MDQ1023303.1 2-polyprenyl-6-methoxyphenol hydroxylase-like FAD-dependent oxidoreductase [Streptomyces umbrinus]